MRTASFAVGLALGLGTAAQAPAGEIIGALGYSQFNSDNARNSLILSLEYRGETLTRFLGADIAPAAMGEVHVRGDVFVGIGLAARWQLPGAWFTEVGVAPGAYRAAGSGNSLGSGFEIRSHIALGRQMTERGALSLALTHKSNADTERVNPGLNALLLRWHHQF